MAILLSCPAVLACPARRDSQFSLSFRIHGARVSLRSSFKYNCVPRSDVVPHLPNPQVAESLQCAKVESEGGRSTLPLTSPAGQRRTTVSSICHPKVCTLRCIRTKYCANLLRKLHVLARPPGPVKCSRHTVSCTGSVLRAPQALCICGIVLQVSLRFTTSN